MVRSMGNLSSKYKALDTGRFLPRLTRNALEEELKALGINKPELPSSTGDVESATTCKLTGPCC